MKILIIGNGYLGKRCADYWPDAVISDKKIYSVADARAVLQKHQPAVVLNAAGVVGKPNVDWCESHPRETIIGNTILPLQIAEACQEAGVYLLHLGTGCVFYDASPDPPGWREDDFANPVAVYTRTKYAADLALSTLPNIGIARIRMPVDYLPVPNNLIYKLVSFPRVIDVENSVTIVEDMVLACRRLLEKRAPGIFHVTNPGAIRHREIIALYEELVDPAHRNEWITASELVAQGLAQKKRSNVILQSSRLEQYGIRLRPIKEALRDTLIKYRIAKISQT
ncbi:MAG: sugar nucleotide-binding protein [Candidatus Magasanikbacteria bacterium]|nr:sugar nucleotide-binding protein [Candidatus Magasanikbacteria bacterium]